jgi:putative ABC transport system permease protein
MLYALRSALQHMLRRLARSPGFTLPVVLYLALGIGTDVTMLSLVDSTLFRLPAHVRDVNRLVDIRVRTYPDYVDLRDQARSFSSVGAWYAPPRPYVITDGDRVVPVQQMLASSSLFQTVGAQPALGRFYDGDEDRPGGPHVAVLGYGLWRRQFGGARDVVGRTLHIAGDLYTIIGVAPEGFTGIALTDIDIFLPITTTKFEAGPAALTSRSYSWLRVVARLAPRVTVAQAQAEAKTIYRRAIMSATVPNNQSAAVDQAADVRPVLALRRELATASIPITLWLAAVATAVLLISCANAAGLLLARAARRRRELAVCAALGASRPRLLADLFLENALLALAGGVLGLVASRKADSLIRRLLLTDLAGVPSPLDVRLVALTLGVTIVTALLSGLWPALSELRGNVALEIANAGRSASAPHARARRLLLIAQLALAMTLVVGASLFTASLHNARAFDLGMSLDSVLISDLDLAGAGYTPERAHALIDPIANQLMAIPGVRSVGISDAGMQPGYLTYSYSVPGRDSLLPLGASSVRQGFSAVTAGFFETLGIPIVQGRSFTVADRSAPVIIISQSFARRYWPGENPVGQCVKVRGVKTSCVEVIGVTRDRHTTPGDTTALIEAFVPLGSPAEPPQLAKLFPLTSVALRVDGNQGRILAAAQRALQDFLPDAPSIRVRPALSMYDRSFHAWRLGATLFTVFGTIAVTLAVFGVYSVTAYLVTWRRRELAIRVALGATAIDLSRLVFSEIVVVTIIGVAFGLVGAVSLAHGARALLFGVTRVDVVVYASAAIGLSTSALLAAVPPVRNAVMARAAVALRDE